MRIDVRLPGITATGNLRERVRDAIKERLARFAHAVDAVVISARDENGPKGGTDTRVQVNVRGPAIGETSVAARGLDVLGALNDALHRSSHTLARQLGRTRRAARAS